MNLEENILTTLRPPPGLEKQMLSFTILDYTLFSLMFGLSAVIGIYYGCFANKQSTTVDYLLGGKMMKVFPIAMSLMASNLSGISLLGIPAEIYMHGTQYWVVVLSYTIMVIFVNTIYLPVFYKLQLNSTYEYLSLRFSNKVRIVSSVLYVLTSLLYVPIVIYIPALAFNQVSGIDLHLITVVLSLVCVFYTTIGGLKAVVWADTLQFTVTLSTLFFVLIMGTWSVGGFTAVWEKSEAGGRIEFFNVDLDPTVRTTFWGLAIGMTMGCVSLNGVNPAAVQRFLAVPTLDEAKQSVAILAIGMVITKSISCFSGLIIYAKYSNCDPISAGYIKRADQIMAYYVLDVASQIPGISGLFVAGVFSTALSMLSTCLNSVSGCVYSDFIAPLMPRSTPESKASNIMKLIVVISGVTCVSLVYLVEKLGGVLELSIAFYGITSGPLLGIFTLGMLFPSANNKGALCGSVGSLIILSWIAFKAQLIAVSGAMKQLPKLLSTNGCPAGLNLTYKLHVNISSITPDLPEEPFWIYKISFYYYTLIGVLLTLIIGLIVSWVTKNDSDRCDDPNLYCKLVHRFLPFKKNKGEVVVETKL